MSEHVASLFIEWLYWWRNKALPNEEAAIAVGTRERFKINFEYISTVGSDYAGWYQF